MQMLWKFHKSCVCCALSVLCVNFLEHNGQEGPGKILSDSILTKHYHVPLLLFLQSIIL